MADIFSHNPNKPFQIRNIYILYSMFTKVQKHFGVYHTWGVCKIPPLEHIKKVIRSSEDKMAILPQSLQAFSISM